MTEVLVAILILAIGAMTTFSLLTTATRNAQRAKASQVALEYAEQELELLRSLKNEQLAMMGGPEFVNDPLSPNYRVKNGEFALQREPLGLYREMVVNGGGLYGEAEIKGGTVAPESAFTSGDVKGRVYRYVVWRNDAKCPEAVCPGKQDYKQIVVAVRVDKAPSEATQRGYYEVQSNFINPTDNAEKDPVANSSGNVVTAQQFFLTDTTCSPTGTTVRQTIAGNHLLHNTLGTCASGMQTGGTPGAPDTLLVGSPPDPDFEDPNNPAEYDYANDSYLDTTPDTGTGVQIRKADVPSCDFELKGSSNPETKVHRWVTDPMKAKFVMTEKATLQFYTRSINNSSATGTACVYLYKWKEGGLPTLLTNTSGATQYWKYTPKENANWPTTWTKERLTMYFNGSPVTIEPGERLGLALSVERANTGGEALAFMYDHPKYPARLEVDTNTPLEGE